MYFKFIFSKYSMGKIIYTNIKNVRSWRDRIELKTNVIFKT